MCDTLITSGEQDDFPLFNFPQGGGAGLSLPLPPPPHQTCRRRHNVSLSSVAETSRLRRSFSEAFAVNQRHPIAPLRLPLDFEA